MEMNGWLYALAAWSGGERTAVRWTGATLHEISPCSIYSNMTDVPTVVFYGHLRFNEAHIK
jgi:hypothetical protein